MKILHTLILIFTLFSISACTGDKNQPGKNATIASSLLTKIEKPFSAPDDPLPDLDGKDHRMSDYRGQPIIVNFWATWCPPCRKELPSMNRAWGKVKADGIQMFAINVADDDDTIIPFTGDNPIDFTILLDQNGEASNHWKLKGLPTTFVIDPDGLVVYKATGDREWDSEEILNAVRALKKPSAK